MRRKELVSASIVFLVVALSSRNDSGSLFAIKLLGFLAILLAVFWAERRWPWAKWVKGETFSIGYTAALGLLIALEATLLTYHAGRSFIESLEGFALTLLLFLIFSLGLALLRNRRIIK